MTRRKMRQRVRRGNLIVTVDKEDFVTEVRSELDKPLEVESVVDTRNITSAMQTCKGPWHYKSGRGTELPIAEFALASRGPNKGQLGVICRNCRDRTAESARQKEYREARRGTAVEAVVTNGEVTLIPTTYTPGEKLPEWRVTIVKRTEVIVSAKDYLDAGVAAGEGEVVMVERL